MALHVSRKRKPKRKRCGLCGKLIAPKNFSRHLKRHGL